MADEDRLREKLKTPIAWKAIGIGGGAGIGNLSEVSQSSRVALTPTAVFAYTISIGTAITRGIDFTFFYNSFTFGDDFIRDNLYKTDINQGVTSLPLHPPNHYFVPTHEDMSTKYLSFDFHFVVNPRSPVKFYLGLGYLHTTINNTQTFHEVTIDTA